VYIRSLHIITSSLYATLTLDTMTFV